MTGMILRLCPAVLIAGTSCVMTGFEERKKPDDVVLTRSADQGAITVPRGSRIIVALPGNPSTGYQWTISETDESLLKPGGSSFQPDRDLPGSGGEYRFAFTAVGPGPVRLRLIYKRAWETAVADTFEVTITIDH